jgi:hypothetical protein
MATSCDRVRELASGFVLGALEPAEMAAVRDHLDNCDQPHPELEEFGGIVTYLSVAPEPVEPPAWLRGSIIAAAKADLQAGRRVGKSTERRTDEAAPVRTLKPIPTLLPAAGAADSRVISLTAVRRSRYRRAASWIARAAAVVAVVGLTGFAVRVQDDLNRAAKDQANAQSFLAVLAQQDTKTTPLLSNDGSEASGIAALRPTGHIVVNLDHLAATTADQVYVVWLAGDNGVMVKVGSFTVGDDGKGYLEVDNVPTSASMWIFVCRESNPNVTKPTGPTIVSGSISL